MFSALLVCAGLLSASPPVDETPSEDLATYETAKRSVGRDADAHVKLALWCEAHGLQAERIKHLALAVLIDPTHATARGLMGLVAYRGRWQRPSTVAEKVKADEALGAALAEYNARRRRTPNTADAHWKLGLWCEEKDLTGEARAHFATVVRLDPSRDAAWKRLGCKKENGHWVSEAQLAAEKAEAEAQKQADQHWRPLLTKWRTWLGEKPKKDQAEKALGQVNDPRAVPMVWALFGKGGATHQTLAVQVLGQIDAAGASRALAMLALSGKSPEVRRRATETLKRRDPRESAGMLVALLRDPIKYEVRPVNGPGSAGVLFVEGKRFNVQRLYNAPAPPQTQQEIAVLESFFEGVWLAWNADQISNGFKNSSNPASAQLGRSIVSNPTAAPALIAQATTDSRGARHLSQSLSSVYSDELQSHPGKQRMINEFNYNLAEAQNAAVAAQQQLAADVSAIESYNQSAVATNVKAQSLLTAISGQDLGQDNDSWKKWWTDQQGYAYQSPQATATTMPTYTEVAVTPYTPEFVAPGVYPSCFGAGTLVRTLGGSEPIETLRVGDMVLTQNLKTGALGYKPVLVIHHNPPSPTFLIRMAGDTIVSSPFHRFRKAGQGWVMARDLKPGDTLRLLDGLAAAETVEAGPVQPVYNLDVADDHDFFAGQRGALVHDNTLPGLRQAPFDAEPSLAAMASPKK